ncbi:carbohydrate ABC transporter permease [Bacillus timonensis]|uniref:carbohydrate ABC transporter permease n=1 Tax=Bacillus timonensis TaxID=1033734 RepID=UPI000287F928|nr:carbohydrate ABC transporter permease [Bacillus timonensis]
MNKNQKTPIILYLVHIVLAFLVLFPLFFAFSSSFRPLDEIFKYINPLTWKTFFPTNITLDAYISLFTERGFGRIFFNTIFVAFITVLFGIIFNSLAAFAFVFFNFKGKNLLFVIVLITFMIPFEVIAIPLYNVVDAFGMIDSYSALIVPAIANGLVIFMFRQSFLDLPYALIEASRVDGASWFKIYYKIIMPLCKPITVGAGLLIFVQQWESFMWPLIATRSDNYKVLQVALSEFNTEYAMIWNELFAAAILGIIVPVVVILCLQRYFVESMTGTGMK